MVSGDLADRCSIARLALVLCLSTFLAPCFSTIAASTTPTIATAYTHQKWNRERGAPKQIFGIAQGKDGYLWLASGEGLYRFDGVRFDRIQPSGPAIHGAPSAVLATRNGDVWTNYDQSHRFAIYRGGRLTLAPPAPVTHRVVKMAEAPDGTIWVLNDGEDDPLLRLKDGRWTVYGSRQGIPVDNPFDLVIAQDGTLWLSHGLAVFRLPPGGTRFERYFSRDNSIARLAIDPAGRIWISETFGSYPITGPNGRGAPPPLRHAYQTDRPQIRGFSLFDRAGNLWMATEYRGVQRVAKPDPRGAPNPEAAAAAIESFTTREGLSSDVTERAFQDREGNVWIGTEKGLDKFRPATVTNEPGLNDPHVFGDQLLAARDGTVFILQSRTVYSVASNGNPTAFLTTRVKPTTVCEAPNGDIWIAVHTRISIWRNGRNIGSRPDIPTDITVYDCAFDAAGNYWISAARGGLFRLRGQHWERMFGETSPQFRPRSMIADAQGKILIQWNNRELRFVGDRPGPAILHPFRIDDPEPVSLYAPPAVLSRAHFYAGGPDGVARMIDGHWQIIRKDRLPQLIGVNGIIVTANGDHWFTASGGIIHLKKAEAERAFADPAYRPKAEIFDEDSGLKSLPHSRSRHAIVQGGDGRLWIATQAGSVWIDPDNVVRNPHPPKLAIGMVRTDSQLYRDPTHVRLPAGQGKVEIDFAVLSLSNPGRVSAEYRMEGQDDRWIDSEGRRQAFYTNLPPGQYRFRLRAANEDGVRSPDEASVLIEVPPTFFQSIWFLFILALVALGLLWALLRLRSAQVAAQTRTSLEQRLIERERIARDLHDTLLQGIQGLIFRIQAVADRMTPGGDDRRLLDTALDRADELVIRGRDSVRDLRMNGDGNDLRRVMQTAADGALLDEAIAVRFVEAGLPRPIHPLALSEIKFITGEALFNIGRHAGASAIEVATTYGRRMLRLRIHDNGRGIDADIIQKGGKDGHYGLLGMRERAEAIGGRLIVRSELGGGTEVIIEVPSKIAYERSSRRTALWRRILALRGRL
ncbi:sensor histidine kinase [Sphingomonas crocodyli]|uniref:sensor histidine kinase n=1 Tax=Sphingomonas crocodyli TaxID=1979270 RepID=UPI0013E349DA|nr:sensor histidine kinase [Sphingomonas crocodyli]